MGYLVLAVCRLALGAGAGRLRLKVELLLLLVGGLRHLFGLRAILLAFVAGALRLFKVYIVLGKELRPIILRILLLLLLKSSVRFSVFATRARRVMHNTLIKLQLRPILREVERGVGAYLLLLLRDLLEIILNQLSVFVKVGLDLSKRVGK